MLLDRIELVLGKAAVDAGSHAFTQDATAYLHKLGVLDIMQTLLGRGWSVPELRLVIALDVCSAFYGMPETIVCFRDATYANYAVMPDHESTHLATLGPGQRPQRCWQQPGPYHRPDGRGAAANHSPNRDPPLRDPLPGPFPGTDIHSHDDYLASSPQHQHMAPMIRRLMPELQHRDDQSPADIYASVYHDFAE
jgi:hypothetical protein